MLRQGLLLRVGHMVEALLTFHRVVALAEGQRLVARILFLDVPTRHGAASVSALRFLFVQESLEGLVVVFFVKANVPVGVSLDVRLGIEHVPVALRAPLRFLAFGRGGLGIQAHNGPAHGQARSARRPIARVRDHGNRHKRDAQEAGANSSGSADIPRAWRAVSERDAFWCLVAAASYDRAGLIGCRRRNLLPVRHPLPEAPEGHGRSGRAASLRRAKMA
mmetsp:Transcript_69025/g.223129  ORF Transcript_69025/g.223129 Transcript_69025/m.223129 type:complete len:220 (+) Transcript_69025:844-1503(+)